MKKIFLSILIISVSQIGFAKNYEVGDTLKVFAKIGLNLRMKDNPYSKKITKLDFGQEVIIAEKNSKSDTIDSRPGSWVKIKTAENQIGYVFDGYLSKFPIPSNEQISNNDFHKYLLSNFPKNSCELIIESPNTLEKKLTSKIIYTQENNITVVETSYWESQDLEFIFKDIRYGELITIAELFYSNYPKAKQEFQKELETEFKLNPNKLKIQILDFDFFLIISNGIESKSITLCETYG